MLPSDSFIKQQYVAPSTMKYFQAIVVFVLYFFFFAYYNEISNPKIALHFFTFHFVNLRNILT